MGKYLQYHDGLSFLGVLEGFLLLVAQIKRLLFTPVTS